MLRDLASLVLGQLASRLLGFVAFAYLARALAPASYGAVEFATGLATVAGIFIDAGVGTIGVRRLAQGGQSIERIAGEVLATRLSVAMVAAAVLALAAWLVVPDPTAARLVALYGLSLLGIPWLQGWLFQGTLQVGYSALVQLVRAATFAAGVLLLVRGAHGAVTVGLLEIAAVAAAAGVSVALQARRVGPVRLYFDPRSMVALVRESLPVGLSNVIWAFNQYFPPLLVASLAGLSAAAFFGAGHRLCISLSTFAWVYHFNLFPSITRGVERGRPHLEPLVRDSLRLTAWGSVALAAALSVAAEPLLVGMFGAPFAAGAAPFALLVWTLPIQLLSDHPRWTLVASGHDRAVTAVQSAGTAVTLVLGLLLIPRHGPLGGAIAVVVAAVVVWALLQGTARRRLGWMPLRPVAVPLALAATAVVGARLLALPPLAEGVGVGLLLAGAALACDRQLIPASLRLARSRERATVPPAVED
jgi:O-antigen/teichoic acid export membrane protein